MIRILLWDIDGTVLNFHEAEKAAIRAGFQRYGLGTCSDEMLARYSVINLRFWEALERGEMTKPEILVGRFREFFRSEGLDPSKAETFNETYQTDLGETICFNDDAFAIISSLRGRVLQYAVTNGTKIAQEKKLRLSGLYEVLDGAFISEDIGIEKPGAGYFDAVFAEIFRQVGTFSKNEVMIVGDSLTSDMRGGSNAGIVTCWYDPEEKKEHPADIRIDHRIRDLHEVEGLLTFSCIPERRPLQ